MNALKWSTWNKLLENRQIKIIFCNKNVRLKRTWLTKIGTQMTSKNLNENAKVNYANFRSIKMIVAYDLLIEGKFWGMLRCTCNIDWISLWTQTSCHTLAKIISHHFPLKLEFSIIIVSFYCNSSFCKCGPHTLFILKSSRIAKMWMLLDVPCLCSLKNIGSLCMFLGLGTKTLLWMCTKTLLMIKEVYQIQQQQKRFWIWVL